MTTQERHGRVMRLDLAISQLRRERRILVGAEEEPSAEVLLNRLADLVPVDERHADGSVHISRGQLLRLVDAIEQTSGTRRSRMERSLRGRVAQGERVREAWCE